MGVAKVDHDRGKRGWAANHSGKYLIIYEKKQTYLEISLTKSIEMLFYSRLRFFDGGSSGSSFERWAIFFFKTSTLQIKNSQTMTVRTHA